MFNPHNVTMFHHEAGGCIDYDMFYREYLHPNGATYELLVEKQHTKDHIKQAKKWLKRNLDVVKIELVREKTLN